MNDETLERYRRELREAQEIAKLLLCPLGFVLDYNSFESDAGSDKDADALALQVSDILNEGGVNASLHCIGGWVCVITQDLGKPGECEHYLALNKDPSRP